jgi:hypothetical protein
MQHTKFDRSGDPQWPGRFIFQRLQPASLVEIAPSNGMDGSPFRPQAESLQLEGELL